MKTKAILSKMFQRDIVPASSCNYNPGTMADWQSSDALRTDCRKSSEGETTADIRRELLEACRKCDPKAQFQIYKLYYKAIYNISLKFINDPAEAEDFMQESFLVAFDRIGAFSGGESFGTWLKNIVLSQANERFRRGQIPQFS